MGKINFEHAIALRLLPDHLKHLIILMMCIFSVSCKDASNPSTPTSTPASKSAQPNPTSKIAWTHLTIYHTQGKVKKIIHNTYLAKKVNHQYQKVTLGTRYETLWNENGVLKEQSYFNSSLKRQNKTNYLSNAKHLWTSAITTNPDGKLMKNHTFQYQPNGLLMQEEHANAQRKPMIHIQYKWTSAQQLIERTTWNNAGKLTAKCTYQLNDKGHPIQTTYDYLNNRTQIICKTQYTQFDKEGNWIQAIETTSKGSIFMHERQLLYFP